MCLLPGSSVKIRAFTLVEALASTLIIGVVMAALSVTLTVGENSKSISTAQVDLQANVRGVLDIVARDFRKTVTQEIVNSEPVPTTTYTKFRPVQRWNVTNANYELEANFTEYNYSAANTTLVRNILNSAGAVLSSRNFYNITAAPFYTVDTSDESVVPLTKDTLQASNGRVVIVIAGENQARQGRVLSYNLTEEVKVRNE